MDREGMDAEPARWKLPAVDGHATSSYRAFTAGTISSPRSLREDFSSAGRRAFDKRRAKSASLAAQVKRERDERLHRHLLQTEPGGPPPRVANLEEVEMCAKLLNKRLAEVIFEPTARSWYKMFIHMDDDGSGKISYHELEDMVRNELKVPVSQFSEEQLQAIWRALDEDRSGLITCGEFGHFMRQGLRAEKNEKATRNEEETSGPAGLLRRRTAQGQALRQVINEAKTNYHASATAEERARRERTARQHNREMQVALTARQIRQEKSCALANEVRAERDKALSRYLLQAPPSGAPPRTATDQEVKEVSILVNRQMIAVLEPNDRSWYKYFLLLDIDRSGNISYWELEELIRIRLKLSYRDLPEEQLQAIWRNLDEDKSGLISCGEFGRFMRMGAHVHAPDPSTVGKGKLENERKACRDKHHLERQQLLETWRSHAETDSAARREKARKFYEAAQRGVDLQPTQAWRSPRALTW